MPFQMRITMHVSNKAATRDKELISLRTLSVLGCAEIASGSLILWQSSAFVPETNHHIPVQHLILPTVRVSRSSAVTTRQAQICAHEYKAAAK